RRAAQHRTELDVRGRAGDADRPARGRPRPGGRGGRGGRAAAVRARRPRLRVVAALMGLPRVRVSALLRWHGRILLCRQEKPGNEYWLLAGRGGRGGETPVGAVPQ